MSKTVHISSSQQFRSLLSSSPVVIADFYADWCGPCKAIAPLYEQLSAKHSAPNAITFTKVNVDNQQEIARQYGVTAMPTFLILHNGTPHKTLRGADPRGLTAAVEAATKLSTTPVAKSIYNTPGRTLGGAPSARQPQSLQKPFMRVLEGWFMALVAMVGMYFWSLFSIDPYKAAEASPFNVNKVEERKEAAKGAAGVKRPAPQGKRVGTLADITGE